MRMKTKPLQVIFGAIFMWFSFLIVVTLESCATVGIDFSTKGVKHLQVQSTTEADVVSLFGEPHTKQNRSSSGLAVTNYTYVYAEGTPDIGRSRRVALEFINGVLNAYLYHSALEGDTSDFNINARSKLKARISVRKDCIDLFGPAHGEVIIPSLLLKSEFGDIPQLTPPATATRAIVYNYLIVKRDSGGSLKSHMKLLLIFLTDDDKVVKVNHFVGVL